MSGCSTYRTKPISDLQLTVSADANEKGNVVRQSSKLKWVGLFAVGFAYVESAVVVYLRRLYGISDLVLDIPPFDPTVALIELGREIATLIILLSVGWVAGRTRQARLGFAFFAFGIWDIFYYIWLKLFIDWPASPLTPDILFLVPIPWWGPVIGPVLIAGLMVISGARAVFLDDEDQRIRFSVMQWMALAAGMLIVLFTFMADSLAALPASPEVLSQLRPAVFNWPVYIIGLVLMAWPVLKVSFPRNRVG